MYFNSEIEEVDDVTFIFDWILLSGKTESGWNLVLQWSLS